jgi:putative addiction module component (TIGR02574 family)
LIRPQSSRNQILHDLAMHIGQAEAAAWVEVGQVFVVNAQQAQLETESTLADTAAMSVTAIQSEVLNLSAVERARLLDLIWDSLSEPEIKAREAAWAAESERRIDAYESGKLTARPAADVFSDLKNLRK